MNPVYALLKTERSPEGKGRLGFIKQYMESLNLLKALSILQVFKAYLGFFPVIQYETEKGKQHGEMKKT